MLSGCGDESARRELVESVWGDLDLDEPDDGEPAFYSYRNASGRTVYVSDLAYVPPEFRDQVEGVDLSHIDLNDELGNDWRDAVEEEHTRLKAHEFCAEAEEDADAGVLHIAWKRHGYLILLGGLLLLLLLATPWGARTVGTRRWMGLLFVVVPLIGYVAFTAYGVNLVRQTLQRIDEDALLCNPESFAAANPRTQGSMIEQLRARIAERQAERAAEIDALFNDQRANPR
ncbi:MAG: hypothetical protein AAGF12_35915 [Myxococcota bacterium]